MTKNVVLVAVFVIGCGSSNGSAADLAAKCMRLCQRSNSVCGNMQDCATDCSVDTSHPPVCLNEGNALFDCGSALSDTDLCHNIDSACASQEQALDACFTAAASDAGSTADTGAP